MKGIFKECMIIKVKSSKFHRLTQSDYQPCNFDNFQNADHLFSDRKALQTTFNLWKACQKMISSQCFRLSQRILATKTIVNSRINHSYQCFVVYGNICCTICFYLLVIVWQDLLHKLAEVLLVQ